jgi:polysaccharide deacetylase family protein (PEP-CTERM system associated)
VSSLVTNFLTVDVEDYYQVSAFDRIVPRSEWGRREDRVCRNTDRILEMFDEAGVTGTFFVLGWVAERHPDLVRRISAAGHEIASHGYGHRLVYELRPREFREDIRRSRAVLESICSAPVQGYRAPSFSITERSLWALDVLIEEGFVYDASIYPIRHDRYGIPSAPREAHWITRPAGRIWEVPGSTVRVIAGNLPFAGGGYFRLLPYQWTRWAFRRVNGAEGRPVVFYIHPWELDADQPRLPVGRLTAIRHYRNLSETEPRMRRLLSEFAFGPVASSLSGARLATPALHAAPALSTL